MMDQREYKEEIMGYCDWVRNTLFASFPEYEILEKDSNDNLEDEYRLIWGYRFYIKTPYKEIHIPYYFNMSNLRKLFFVRFVVFKSHNEDDPGFAIDDYMVYRHVRYDGGVVDLCKDMSDNEYDSYRKTEWFPKFEYCEYKDYQEYTLRWIDFIKALMATEEIHRWLYSDLHLSVPRDWSPYK